MSLNISSNSCIVMRYRKKENEFPFISVVKFWGICIQIYQYGQVMPIIFKFSSLYLPCCDVSFVIHTHDAELIDINLCLNNVGIYKYGKHKQARFIFKPRLVMIYESCHGHQVFCSLICS